MGRLRVVEILYIAIGFVISVAAGVGLAKVALVGFFSVVTKGQQSGH
jgi:hypothetical protein